MRNPRDTFFDYVADRRSQNIRGFSCDVTERFTRYTPLSKGLEGFIVFTRLANDDASQTIQQEIEYFADIGTDFEWKVYDYDEPSNLRTLLRDQSFVAGESEAFMLRRLGSTLGPTPRTSKARIVHINDAERIGDIIQVQEQVWGQPFDWLSELLIETLRRAPDELSLYCAYIEGVPIGTGWTTFAKGSRYPEVHGGAVLPAWRGRGIYGELSRIRFEEIVRRGFAVVAVDASPMSEPILAKFEFERICMTHPMRMKFKLV